ncbi:hypothetical protein DF3PA_170044 [Candidatus Defluviicoccus seviourii]|uniref:Uncharacterized protein n=2 Tax=root TaxID=1 RepID=A0A564WEH3_9PROT|nr:hypothetical protein DF3PB_2930003 [uncultured Defluviicoccus sp.]VUX45943.1 hypothetical protein DF3PA_170044 [Candidatus Defluviicoccus seviourii]
MAVLSGTIINCERPVGLEAHALSSASAIAAPKRCLIGNPLPSLRRPLLLVPGGSRPNPLSMPTWL